MCAKLRVGLALTINNSFQIDEQVGQVLFAALAATPAEGIDADHSMFHFPHPETDGPAIPAQLTFSQSLTPFTQGLNAACHKQTQCAAFEILGRVQQQGFDSSMLVPPRVLFLPQYTISG